MITLDRRRLSDAASFASRALPRATSIPVLTGLRVTGSKTGVTVSAFDFDLYAEATVTTEAADFDLLVPGRTFATYLAGMTGAQVTLDVGERQAELSCGSARVTLPLLSLADYPTPPTIPDSLGVVDGAALALAFTHCKESVDPNIAVQTMRGVIVEAGATLTLAGVHNHRLIAREVDGWEGDTEATAIVPVPVGDAVKALDGPVTVAIEGGLVAFADATRCICARVIDGQPSPWRKLFDGHTAVTTVTVDRIEFADALKWVASGDTRKDTFGHCRVSIGTDVVTVSLWGAEGLGATTEVEAKVDGDGCEMGWKAENLLHGLAATDATTVTLGLSGPRKAALLTADSDPGFRYLCMPVALPEAK